MSNHCFMCEKSCKQTNTCPNGHVCCEIHFLERIKCIYKDGQSAFNANGQGQKCFMCRVRIPDNSLSKMYFENLKLVIAQGVIIRYNLTKTNEELLELAKECPAVPDNP